MSASIRLEFIGGSNPVLDRVSFRYASLKSNVLSVRGKTAGAYRSNACFQWTPAVKALCILLLKTRASSSNESEAVLSGGGGSHASALDYALSKLPLWLFDMFGQTSDGVSLTRYLFQRTNPERKRGGDVTIGVRRAMLAVDAISIVLDGTIVECSGQLTAMYRAIAGPEKRAPGSSRPRSQGAADLPKDLGAVLAEAMHEEVSSVLQETEIFCRDKLQTAVRSIQENPLLREFGAGSGWASSLVRYVSPAAFLGMTQRDALAEKLGSRLPEMRIAIAVGMDGPFAVLEAARKLSSLAVSLDWGYAYASQIVSEIAERGARPDGCVLCLASAAEFASTAAFADYTPFMILPKTTHRVVTPRGAERNRWDEREFYLVQKNPTVSSLYFNQIMAQRGGRGRRSSSHADTQQISSLLSSAGQNESAILWYPFYQLSEHYLGARRPADVPQDSTNVGSVLFLKRDLIDDPATAEALEAAIRDAWLTLLEDRRFCRSTVDRLAGTAAYVKFVRRVAGLTFGETAASSGPEIET